MFSFGVPDSLSLFFVLIFQKFLFLNALELPRVIKTYRVVLVMKFYSEEETKNIRMVLEREVLNWFKVDFKKMFGCPCYTANGKLFVFLVTKGIVITHLGEEDRVKLSTDFMLKPFQAGSKSIKNWCQIYLEKPEALAKILPFVRKSYEEALKE